MKTIDIVGSNYTGTWESAHTACRGIIMRDHMILLSYETATDQWMLPGGGLEPGEDECGCCMREVAEETGLLVQPSDCSLEIDEYYKSTKWINRYYICEITGKTAMKLTGPEKEAGMEPRWLPLQRIMEIFSRHDSFAGTDALKQGMYLREYTALCELFGKQDVRITEAELTEDTLTELIRLSDEWAKENSCYGYRKNEKPDIDGNRIFLAYIGDTVAGYLFGHTEISEKAGSIMPDGTPYFEVEELYVRPDCRGRGIGKRLFRCAEKAVSDETDFIMLSTASKNWKAILHFYIDELDMRFWSARLYKRVRDRGPED